MEGQQKTLDKSINEDKYQEKWNYQTTKNKATDFLKTVGVCDNSLDYEAGVQGSNSNRFR